ncbi:hypothetical protein PHYSODRAFT_415800, partial [Phytophthora sojae]
MIAEFVQHEGSQCLLIQDDWDLTVGIVVQSAAQREIFARWGDTLVLDWTHNTNNAGFYLGTDHQFILLTWSLIVTVPSGRGISVLDFLCVNQQKETPQEVFKYFKKTN